MPSNYRDIDGRDPFSDERGSNPFADDGQDVAPPDSEDPYTPTATESYRHRPGDFETILPHRGRLILGLAIVGLLAAVLGIPAWYFQSTHLGFLALAATLPACIFAVSDLRAMRMGAMDPSGYRTTIWGGYLGLLGSGVAAFDAVVLIAEVFFRFGVM